MKRIDPQAEQKIIRYLKHGKYNLDELYGEFKERVPSKKALKGFLKTNSSVVHDKDKFTGERLYYSAYVNLTESIYKANIPGDGIYAQVSDTHLGNKVCRLDLLEAFYDIAEREGVHNVFHAGDISEGVGHVYKGQLNDLLVYGDDALASYVAENYPKRRGMKTLFLSGNHDLDSWIKTGVDRGQLIQSKRKEGDMVYLGQYQRDVELSESVIMRLLHPAGTGNSYAKSYKLQRYIDRLAPKHKPKILVFGHFHENLFMFHRNIAAYHGGTFLDETEFVRRLGFGTQIGGWINEIKIRNGELMEIKPRWISFYR